MMLSKILSLADKGKVNTPPEQLAYVIGKRDELTTSLPELEFRLVEVDQRFKDAMVDDALGSKTAADQVTEAEAELHRIKAKIEGAKTAIEELDQSIPDLTYAVKVYDDEQREITIKTKAKADLKKAPAALSKAQKASIEFTKAIEELAAIDRIAATNLMDEANSVQFHRWSGYADIDQWQVVKDKTELESIKYRLNQLIERGSRGRPSQVQSASMTFNERQEHDRAKRQQAEYARATASRL